MNRRECTRACMHVCMQVSQWNVTPVQQAHNFIPSMITYCIIRVASPQGYFVSQSGVTMQEPRWEFAADHASCRHRLAQPLDAHIVIHWTLVECSTRGWCDAGASLLGLLLVCPKNSWPREILNNLTNRTLSRSWCVGMTTVKFFSRLSLAEARGTQKENFCLFLNTVPFIYIIHYVLFYLQQKMVIFPVRPICGTLCSWAGVLKCSWLLNSVFMYLYERNTISFP
jgi:hypothetical protein